jgi:hypothetical protein
LSRWPPSARQPRPGRYLHALATAKRHYASISKPSEAARADYITRLDRLRDKAADAKTDAWQAIDAEIKQHPAPQDADNKALSALRVGQWESPRHDYLYRADGTWTMLPAEPDITQGAWRIDGNQYFDTAATDPPLASPYHHHPHQQDRFHFHGPGDRLLRYAVEIKCPQESARRDCSIAEMSVGQ